MEIVIFSLSSTMRASRVRFFARFLSLFLCGDNFEKGTRQPSGTSLKLKKRSRSLLPSSTLDCIGVSIIPCLNPVALFSYQPRLPTTWFANAQKYAEYASWTRFEGTLRFSSGNPTMLFCVQL